MYHNVEIKFIHGKKATLTIFDDGEETETIMLSDIKTESEMHSMMQEKGFKKMSWGKSYLKLKRIEYDIITPVITPEERNKERNDEL